jgi:peptidoglycan/LPS O-acetylase OafA/YrhL
VLAACLVAGWLLLLPDQYKSLGSQIVAGAGFAANLLMWKQAGYFDIEAQVKPLLHLWSLGIEEQFYLTWPLIIAFLYKRSRHLSWTLGALLVFSFATNIALVFGSKGLHASAEAAFYSPISRLWELLMGAALAYSVLLRPAREPESATRAEVLSAAGLLLLGSAIVLLTPQNAFPGWWALLPTLGTLLLIATPSAWINRALLSNRLLVFVGLISYPLYLWHWLLLALLRARLDEDGGEAPRLQRVAVVAVAFVLAWFTYVCVEKPIRFGRHPLIRPAGLLWLMGAVAGLGAAVYLSDGAAFRYPASIRPVAAYPYEAERDHAEIIYRRGKCLLDRVVQTFGDIAPECTDPADARKPLLVLWGDSHAGSLYPGLKALQGRGGDFRVAQFTKNACPPIVDPVTDNHTNCKGFNDDALRKIIELKPNIVLMEGDWWVYLYGPGDWKTRGMDDLQRTVRLMLMSGVPRVVVFGSLPVWSTAQPRATLKGWLASGQLENRSRYDFNEQSARADTLVRQNIAATGAVFVSPIEVLCNERGCLTSAREDVWSPVSWDEAHLTQDGSELLVNATASRVFGGKVP